MSLKETKNIYEALHQYHEEIIKPKINEIITTEANNTNEIFKTTEEIMRLLSFINRSGTTVIMVTHDTNAVSRCHGRIIQIHNGEIVQDIIK